MYQRRRLLLALAGLVVLAAGTWWMLATGSQGAGVATVASGHEKIPVCGQLAPGVRSSEFPVHGHEISRRAACPDVCDPSGMGGFEVSVSRPSSRRDRDQVWQGDHGDSRGV